jgi:hypothetical protein
VPDTFEALFKRPIREPDGHVFAMATGEAVACLNYLMDTGEVRKELRDGVAWYSIA